MITTFRKIEEAAHAASFLSLSTSSKIHTVFYFIFLIRAIAQSQHYQAMLSRIHIFVQFKETPSA
ncbi:hypothetical protein N476_06765 [Pseudoalteromonas luteoviolacea H33]|uniref:Uncharacterized protein n=1 Tax=Pseudoalteromonas luteoviolacea H33 TaxID=1365251 RepID=A0A167GRJ8_9GAMM|nr:hypothetical protein N476_06765 [Pseudoalteromonas luteoviolacea H33]KZN77030.1 hypothetical protein N477_13715 [Pseudoalteromonas luteoviolacea H33-S]